MRVLFGVQGTGNGHISRSRTLARALAAQGIEVDYLFSGRARDGYFEMEAFGDYRSFGAQLRHPGGAGQPLAHCASVGATAFLAGSQGAGLWPL